MRSTRDASLEQEKRIARLLDGRVVSNSGARPFNKGDVITDFALIDGKTVMEKQKSITLQKEYFTTIKEQAFSHNIDFGVIAFDFGDGEDYYAVDARTFKKLVDAYKEAWT